MARRVKVTKAHLNKFMKHWQKKMKLMDWEMRIDFATEEQVAARLGEDGDMPNSAVIAKQSVACTDASNQYQTDTSWLENRRNRILVKMDPDLTLKQAESIVVHEMLHVMLWHLAPNDNDASATIMLEQVINTLESMLVNGDRDVAR